MKQIIILYDYVNEECLSYHEAMIAIHEGKEKIVTNCIWVLRPWFLDKFEMLIRTKDGQEIRVQDFEPRYTQNISKMFMAGKFGWFDLNEPWREEY